jgi:hypothetical protein
MWSFVERYKQNRARRKFMPEPRRRGTGTIAKFAIGALVLILAASAALQLRGGSSATTDFIKTAKATHTAPLDLIERAARAHRLVFLADVPSATAPKDLMAHAVERVARGPGLDVVALEIDAGEQPEIDRYFSSTKEDASILIGRPRLIHEDEGVSRSYLEILRAVRRMNDQLGADRQIRVIALDLPDWPPANAIAPSEAARLFGERDSVMYANIAGVLNMNPKARVLFFTDGLHALKDGTGVVQTGGTRTVQVSWLASRLAKLYPQDVYSILVDATPSRIPSPAVASYRGTASGSVLRDAGVSSGTSLVVDQSFNFSRNPINIVEKPGIHFDLTPHELTFTQLADAYIYLGS